MRCLVNPVTLRGSRCVFFVAARQGSAVAAGRAAETQVKLSDAASDDLVTMDAWEPERPSVSRFGIRARIRMPTRAGFCEPARFRLLHHAHLVLMKGTQTVFG